MSKPPRQASEAVIAECLALVAPAETAFRSRWRMTTLQRVDAELHDLLKEQLDLYSTELMSGSEADLRMQSEAMVRGWAAACRCMESQPDDAYLVGIDWSTKTQLVVADSKRSIDHVRPHDACRVIAMTPDELANAIGRMGMVATLKSLFPDAEVIDAKAREAA